MMGAYENSRRQNNLVILLSMGNAGLGLVKVFKKGDNSSYHTLSMYLSLLGDIRYIFPLALF